MVCRVLLLALALVSSVYAQDNYNYFKQGADWTGLCATGQRQSPVNVVSTNIVQVEDESYEKFSMNYPAMPNYIRQDLNDTYIVLGDMGELVTPNPTSLYASSYAAWGMYFHAPSEHTLDGSGFDAEVQFIHSAVEQPINEYTNFIAMSVVFKGGPGVADSPLLKSIFDKGEIDFSQIFSKGSGANNFAMYTGSLTVPPCTENINWFLYEFPQPISQSQLDFFQDKWAKRPEFAGGNGNNRKVQLLNGRQVYSYKAPNTNDRIEYD